MKPLAELDHYEVLEIPRDAGPGEVERAYRLIRSAYAEGAVAGYSLFEEHDAEALRERIETAYRVLSDPDARREYDASLKGEAEAALGDAPRFESPRPAAAGVVAGPLAGFDDAEGETEDAVWDGARLRRARLVRGVELEQISKVTKINPNYLRCLEEEAYEELPAPVYVRGFVIAYARALRLDGPRVAAGYMQRYEAQHGARRRTRLLSRLGGLGV